MSTIRQAISDNDLPTLRRLITPENIDYYLPETGNTPLLEAIAQKRPQIARMLIMRGANLNRVNFKTKLSPLHAAIEKRMNRTIYLLAGLGADLEAADEQLRKPLFLAVSDNQLTAAKSLLERGANPNGWHFYWCSPLCLAHWKKTRKMIGLLKSHGADINARDKDGKTELFHATYGDWAKALIKAGIDVNARDKNGQTALFGVATDVELFLESDGVDDIDSYMESALMLDALLRAGAQVAIADKRGQTVFDIVTNKAVWADLEKAFKRQNRRIARNNMVRRAFKGRQNG